MVLRLRGVVGDPAEVGAGTGVHGRVGLQTISERARDTERGDASYIKATGAVGAISRTAAVTLQCRTKYKLLDGVGVDIIAQAVQ